VGADALGALNILIDADIIGQEEAKSLSPKDVIDGALLLKRAERLAQIADCDFNDDYDADRVLNQQDLCPYTYDPTQENVDKDSM